MERDEQEIRRLIGEWHARTARGDLDAILDFMTDDVRFLRCGASPMDKAGFAAGFREWAGRAAIESTFEITDLHTSGDLGYACSHISIVITPHDAQSRIRREGDVLSVFRKSPTTGSWRLARDANLMAGPEPA